MQKEELDQISTPSGVKTSNTPSMSWWIRRGGKDPSQASKSIRLKNEDLSSASEQPLPDAASVDSNHFILKNQDELEEEEYKQLIDRLGLEEEEIELLLRKMSKFKQESPPQKKLLQEDKEWKVPIGD